MIIVNAVTEYLMDTMRMPPAVKPRFEWNDPQTLLRKNKKKEYTYIQYLYESLTHSVQF